MSVQPNFDIGPAGPQIHASRQKFVGDILKKRAFLTPQRPALEWGGRCWTYAELNAEVNALAHGLQQAGVRRGERIAVLAQNRAECAHLLYAAAKTGAIVAFLNWRYTAQELQEAIEVITAETLVVSAAYAAQLFAVLPRLPFARRVILLDPLADAAPGIATHAFAQLISSGNRAEPAVDLHEEDALYIVYTSGTTGRPKGAVISQRAEIQRTLAFLATYPALLGTDGDDACIARGPFFHVTSVHELFTTHALGGKVIILAGYDVAVMVDLLERERVSWLSLSPGMYDALVDEIRRRGARIKGVRAIGSIPDVTPHEQIAALTTAVGAPFLNTYGLTEIGMENFSGSVLPIGGPGASYDDMAKDDGFFCDVRLLDADGNAVPDGEPGELVLRTTMMFSGYWNNPQENQKVFRGGWFHSGDVMRRTADGRLDFVSRTKYLIKSGGENIYPAEIERVLLMHPAVREACVVGASHPKWGETPVAFVALGEAIDTADLLAFCREHLARYRVPNVIEVVAIDDFPRNLTGKVLREQVEPWIERVRARIT